MRKLILASIVGAVFALPVGAEAGLILEGSVGKGATVSPETNAEPTNLMVAPGLSFPFIRLQLGLVADLPDVEARDFDIGLRPMLTINPPVLPLYGRLIFAFNNLLDSELRTIAYGGALGIELGLPVLSLFAEVGVLPRSLNDEFWWVIEGRLGVSLGF